MDIFNNKFISPMLFFESEVFDSDDYIYELKFDGLRSLAYIDDDKTTLINKRFKDITPTFPELSNLHESIKKRCILDGEIVVMKDGKPDFFLLQKRALLVDSLKVKISQIKNPVTFIAFDILYIDDKLLIDEKLINRKEILSKNVIELKNLVISRYIERNGVQFFNLAKEANLEGIVAKEKLSKYYPGKRSRVWLKMKVYQEDDLIICGYVQSDTGVKDVIFGRYEEDNSIQKAAVIMTSKDKNLIIDFAKKNPNTPLFNIKDKDIIWMKPYLVGRVRYMMKTKSGGLRQAVFLGVRNDKTAEELKK